MYIYIYIIYIYIYIYIIYIYIYIIFALEDLRKTYQQRNTARNVSGKNKFLDSEAKSTSSIWT